MRSAALVAPLGGLLDTFNGLPTHPLVIHAALALVVLTAIGGVLSAVPRWRGWMLPATTVIGVLAAVSTLVATETGESLEHRLGGSDLIEAHAEAGERTRTVAVVLAVLLVAWWAVERAQARAALAAGAEPAAAGGGGTARPNGGGVATATRPATRSPALRLASLGLAVVTVAVSVLSAVLIYVTGERGARAVWHDAPTAPPAASEPARS